MIQKASKQLRLHKLVNFGIEVNFALSKKGSVKKSTIACTFRMKAYNNNLWPIKNLCDYSKCY